jgi:hypothetical protein
MVKILSQDSFIYISIKIRTADFVLNLFLTSLKFPVCQSKILFTQRYWASWSELINQRKYLEWLYSAVINEDVIISWAGVFGVLVGKSVMWNVLQGHKSKVNCWAELTPIKKYMLKSSQIIHSNFGLYKFLKLD